MFNFMIGWVRRAIVSLQAAYILPALWLSDCIRKTGRGQSPRHSCPTQWLSLKRAGERRSSIKYFTKPDLVHTRFGRIPEWRVRPARFGSVLSAVAGLPMASTCPACRKWQMRRWSRSETLFRKRPKRRPKSMALPALRFIRITRNCLRTLQSTLSMCVRRTIRMPRSPLPPWKPGSM